MQKKLTVYRNERKYFLTRDKATMLQEELSKLLLPDPYSADGSYRVRSLYFDSINNDDFLEKDAGVEKRRKIRLRAYSEDATSLKLEIKEKNGDYQHKSSLILNREEAKLLQDGDYSFLLDRGDELSLRFYTLLTLSVYRPAALIEYDRRAFVYDEYSTRITFDTAIRSSETDLDVFSKDTDWNMLLENMAVLEVKYNGKLFVPISKVLKKYNLVNISYSKYTSGRSVMEDYIYGL